MQAAGIPLWLGCVVVLCASDARSGNPDECLPNGGFEQANARSGRPEGWGGNSFRTKAKARVDAAVAHTGRVSARIDSPARSERAGWTHNIRAGQLVRPGTPYLFRGYCRAKDVVERNPGVCARVTYVGGDGKVIRTDYVKPARLADDWRRVEGVVLMPEGAVRFNVVLFLVGSGTVWWDDVSLTPLVGRVEVVSPAPDACVPDASPAFRWKPVQGASHYTLECSSSPTFDDAVTQRIEKITASTVVLPKPPARGGTLYWRVSAALADGREVLSWLADPGGAHVRFPSFFAGTWAQRAKRAVDKLAAYRQLYPKLKAFAERHAMWEKFDRLRAGVERLEKLVAAPGPESLAVIGRLDKEFADLDLFVDWWRRLFLADRALLDRIDLTYPGLEKVRAAHEAGDLERAKAELVAHLRTRAKPIYFVSVKERPAANPKRTANRAAEQLLTHQYPIHSYKTPTFDLGRGLDWHVNPIIDREWPTQLHRHRHWGTLAGSYWNTHNEAYARELARQLLDWVKDNPIERWDPRPGRNRFAWSTLNAASRLIHSWPTVYLYCRQAPAFDVDTMIVMLKALREHGQYLMTHQARGGNWLIAESNALATLGTLFPEFKEAGAWREKGYGRLAEQLFKQTYEDGVHVERTPGYHGGCIRLFLRGLQLALMNDVEFEGREAYVARIEKMYDFYLYGAKPNRYMPVLGDVGRMKVQPVLMKGATMFRRPDMLFVATDGEQGVEPVETSHAFAGSGLYVMRSDWRDANALHLFVDCGGFYGHCHADNFHVDLYAYGRTMLCDAGRYAYAASINQYFRGTIGHNTVLIDHKNQAREPAPERLTWTTCEQFDFLHARHTAYAGIVHERKVLFVKPSPGADGYWVLTDLIAGDGEHRCDQRFHFNPDMPAVMNGLQARSDQKQGANLIVIAPPAEGLTLTKEKGWVSYRWYQKQPTDVAQYTRTGPLPHRFETVFFPIRANAKAGLTVKAVRRDAHATVLAVTVDALGGPFSDTVVLQQGEKQRMDVGGVRTDARTAYVRTDAQGRLVRALMQDGSSLELRGEPVLASPTAVAYAAVALHGDQARVACGKTARLTVHPTPGVKRILLNGAAADTFDLTDVAPPAVRPVPCEPGPPVIEFDSPAQQAATLAPLPSLGKKAPDAAPGAVTIEAETYTAEDGGKLTVSKTKVGASGGAVLNWDLQGHWVEWRFTAPAAGDYALAVRSATAKARALRRIEIDGRTPSPELRAVEFPSTGGYCNNRDDWEWFLIGHARDKPVRIRLARGRHVLRMTNVSGDSLNLDLMMLTPLQASSAR